MRILMSCRQYLPRVGGVQQSVHQLALRLRDRGHTVAVVTAADDYRDRSSISSTVTRALRRNPDGVVRDDELAYPVYRIRDGHLDARPAVHAFEPDVVVANVGGRTTLEFSRRMMKAASPRPVVGYFRDTEGVVLLARRGVAPDAIFTNASTIRDLVTVRGRRVDAVIPSVVDVDAYRTASSRRVVLFVNPRSERKGASIAWALAERRSDVPFVFLEAWRFTPEQRAAYEQRAAQLGNVTIRRSVSDPARIYEDARILFVPYEDNRPRVVAEAQASGIPQLARRFPGLVETVGPGGVFVDPDAPLTEWERALSDLWDDPENYQRLSAAAERHSYRDEIRPETLTTQFETALSEVLTETQTTRGRAAKSRQRGG
jgi:glycosyltransferase involved in cell wall biosynthesis